LARFGLIIPLLAIFHMNSRISSFIILIIV
jgi:hypothetical protein